MGVRIIRMSGMKDKIGLTANPIYDRLNPKSPRFDKKFPQPIKLGNGYNIGFIEAEVDAWIAVRIAERDEKLATLSTGQRVGVLSSLARGSSSSPRPRPALINDTSVSPGAGEDGASASAPSTI